jgi:hypothetical protein
VSTAKKKAQPVAIAAAEPSPEVITAFKGFDLNWKCRSFQYQVGATFHHDGEVLRCAAGGFHSCEYPLDVFNYYPPGESKYAIVEAGGKIDKAKDDDTKIASATITITAELHIPEIVKHAIDWVTRLCKPAEGAAHTDTDRSIASATGYRSASSATGDQSASSATGYRSASSATGDQSASSATGDQSASSATGDQSASSATGDQSASSATGDQSASSATGYRSASSASGLAAVALNTGRYGKAKAAGGGAIVLCCHDDDGNLLHIRAAKVGDAGIKPDTFYTLNNAGEFVEVVS